MSEPVDAVDTKRVERCVLGVDPGSRKTGWGILSRNSGDLPILSGVIKVKSTMAVPDRLHTIFRELLRIIDANHPDILAVERPFYNSYVRSAMILGQAQAAVLLAAAERNLPVVEYAPREIKQVVTGDGSAKKEMVAEALRLQLRLSKPINDGDASDALAAAYCHAIMSSGGAGVMEQDQ